MGGAPGCGVVVTCAPPPPFSALGCVRCADGTCLNRWYDKSLQLIVCENGSAGVNFEHSKMDGHTVLRFASDVFTDTIMCAATASCCWCCPLRCCCCAAVVPLL